MSAVPRITVDESASPRARKKLMAVVPDLVGFLEVWTDALSAALAAPVLLRLSIEGEVSGTASDDIRLAVPESMLSLPVADLYSELCIRVGEVLVAAGGLPPGIRPNAVLPREEIFGKTADPLAERLAILADDEVLVVARCPDGADESLLETQTEELRAALAPDGLGIPQEPETIGNLNLWPVALRDV